MEVLKNKDLLIHSSRQFQLRSNTVTTDSSSIPILFCLHPNSYKCVYVVCFPTRVNKIFKLSQISFICQQLAPQTIFYLT